MVRREADLLVFEGEVFLLLLCLVVYFHGNWSFFFLWEGSIIAFSSNCCITYRSPTDVYNACMVLLAGIG